VAKFRITYNAPVILTFALAAVAVHILNNLLGRDFQLIFAAWPELHDWRSYVGLVSHILGHGNWEHLLGNFTMILLLGPILEERHGSGPLLVMIALTALVTGLVNLFFFSSFLVGASGIVFMLILLASTANIKYGEIPLTFIAVALIYLGGEVVRAFQTDNISQMGHLVGGLAGAAFGFALAAGKSDSGARMLEKGRPI
jgi:membrane associated rhomboid family serine protease